MPPKMPKVALSKCIFPLSTAVSVYYSSKMFSSSKDVATVNFVALFAVVTDTIYFRK